MRGRKTGWRMGILYLLCKEREREQGPQPPPTPFPLYQSPLSPSSYNNNTNENLKRLAFHQSPKHVHNHGNQFHDAFNRYYCKFSPFWPACFLCPKPASHAELCCSPHTENTSVSISPLASNPTKTSVQDKHSLL